MKIPKDMKLADYVTSMNLICGVLSIMFASVGQFTIAAVMMLGGVFFDWFDGRVARMCGNPNDFGKELDSLCDVVSFGVAPAVFFFMLNKDVLYQLKVWPIIQIVILLLFAAGGALRLARFNVVKTKDFIGIPITVNGFAIPILYFISLYFPVVNQYMIIYFAFSAFMMTSSIRLKKVHQSI